MFDVAAADIAQATLFAEAEVRIDTSFRGVERVSLGRDAWVDYQRSFLGGDERLFATVRDGAEWSSPQVVMYDKVVRTPRLTARIDGGIDPVVGELVEALSRRYGVRLDRVSAGFYRDGNDSVAWHGDRVARDLPDALVATVSLAGPRRFLLRPRGGGKSLSFSLGHGDLIVMGGSCQRTWEHTVPKVAQARPRIALMFRHDYPAVPSGVGARS